MIETLVKDIIPQNDEQRVEALHRFEILYTAAEAVFDNITQMMAQVFKAPMSFISLVDKEQVFYKSQVGSFGRDAVNREHSLCSLTILGTEPLIIEDTAGHTCFKGNPYVEAEGGIRFYAGVPLITRDAYEIGTICIVDTKPRIFSENDKSLLVRFASLVMHELELRLTAKSVNDDAKEQLSARRNVEEVKDSLSLILETLPEKGWTANEQGEANFLTKSWYEYTGQGVGEAEGKGWANAIHPDDIEQLYGSWMKSVETAQLLRNEARIRNKEGEYRWHLVKSLPIRDRSGRIFIFGGTCTDIHDRKMKTEELEKKVWERTIELERSNRSLEEFAYAASHDLKAPIRKISTFSERLKDRLKEKLDDKNVQFYLERIDYTSRRMNTLIDDLLSYSSIRRGADITERVDLNESLRMVLDDLELEIQDKGGKITFDPLPTIKGYRRQLQQAFQNILSNAMKYSKPGVPPEVYINASLIRSKDLLFSFPGSDANKQYCLIKVVDNGIGFEQHDAERIFHVFTRLHADAEYSGTGVGLSIVQKVAENHSGYVWAESKPGQGATFNLLLPIE